VEWKPQVADLQKSMEELQKQINQTTKAYEAVTKQLDVIMQVVEEDVHARAIAANEWVQRFEELATSQE
jgi:archaellum component FlaC